MAVDGHKLLEVFRKATVDYGLCPNRVWAVAGDKLPELIPFRELEFGLLASTAGTKVNDNSDHRSCTFDFCEYSQRDFTAVQQRHECLDGTRCALFAARFSRGVLEDAACNGISTVWALDGGGMLPAPRPYMAISHVWSDGTGAGAWTAGQVNECLYYFFADIARRFGCEGIWWDTICVPTDKVAREKAIRRIQSNYQRARITLVHDTFLRGWRWDPETACFGILMSPWFSRGWTALELAKSRKVKVIFKGEHGPVIKDLDEDILERDGNSIAPRSVASGIIRQLRKNFTKLNGLLTALGSRATSWPKDMAIISALLLDIRPEEKQQDTYQKVLRAVKQLAPGHLFHNSATMSNGFEWCPASLLSMPVDPTPPSLFVLDDGDLLGFWRVSRANSTLETRCSWSGTHSLVEQRLRHVLRTSKDGYLLAEVRAKEIKRALLVNRIGSDIDGIQRYALVGAVYPHPPLNPLDAGVWEVQGVKLAGRTGGNPEPQSPEDREPLEGPATTLHQAVLIGDETAFDRLVTVDGQNVPDSLGQLPVHIAAERGHAVMVKRLSRLANSMGRCKRGQTAMHRAALGGSDEVVKQLVRDGYNFSEADEDGDTPLHIAANMGNGYVVSYLIGLADPDEKNLKSQTPLHYAAMRGECSSVRLLMGFGASSKAKDNFGWTVFHYAAGSGNVCMIELLLGLKIGEFGQECAEEFVNCKDDLLGWTPMHFAAMSGCDEVIRLLRSLGAKSDVKDDKGWTPRHFAEMNQHSAVLELLADQGAELDIICSDVVNITPLHCRASNVRQSTADMLLNMPASVILDGDGGDDSWSPLLFTIEHKLEVAFARLLPFLKAGVDGKAVDGLLKAAIESGHTAALQRLLASWPAKDLQAMLMLAIARDNLEAVELLLDSGAGGATAGPELLLLAVQRGSGALARILLARGAPCDSREYSRSPLSFAAEAGHNSLVTLLLDKGANVDSADADNQTPLSHAAACGNIETVRILLDRQARVDGLDPILTPLRRAAHQGHGGVVQLLRERKARTE